MKFAGNHSDRPEQLLAHDLISDMLPEGTWIDTEVKVKDIKPAGGVDLTGLKMPRLDIAFHLDGVKVAIRCMGPPHEEQPQERKDVIQRLVLEHRENGYWVVIDFWYHKMKHLWALDTAGAIKEILWELKDYNGWLPPSLMSYVLRLT